MNENANMFSWHCRGGCISRPQKEALVIKWLNSVIIFLLIAFNAPAQFAQPFSSSASLDIENGKTVLTVTLSVPEDHYIYSESVSIKSAGSAKLLPVKSPASKEKHDLFSNSTVGVFDHNIAFQFTVEQSDGAPVEIIVKYQGCSSTMCFMPQSEKISLTPSGSKPDTDRSIPDPVSSAVTSKDWRDRVDNFTVVGQASGYLKPESFIEFLNNLESGKNVNKDNLQKTFEEKNIWLSIILIILGGLALNLTPCVLPMIPINIAIIGAGAHAGSRKRGFALGGTYGAGIALAYGALGLAVILTGTRFGTLNSSPWFNFGIAMLFLFMSLAMFGIINIDFSRFQGISGAERKGGYITALVMGFVAALLAGACVAPVVISVLLLATNLYSRGNVAGLFLPFLLGFGMALPWPFAGAGLSFLPKPGKWMEKIKYGFGVIIIIFAAWYGIIGYSLLTGRNGTNKTEVVSAEADCSKRGWVISLDEGFARAEQENKPVLIDMWASWCKSCLQMERTTFKDKRVCDKLDSFVKIKYQAEKPNEPEIKAVLDHFNVIGLPTYVVLMPNKETRNAEECSVFINCLRDKQKE